MNWHQLMEAAFSELKASGAAGAEPLLQKALLAAGTKAEYRAVTLFNLGLCFYDLKRVQETEKCFAEAIELLQDLLPKENELYGMFVKTMIEFYEKENRLSESKHYYLLEIEHTKNMYGPRHPYVANMINEYAELLLKTGEFAQAEKNLNKSLEILTAARGVDHEQNATIHRNLARVYQALGRQSDHAYHQSRADVLRARRDNQAALNSEFLSEEEAAGIVEQTMD